MPSCQRNHYIARLIGSTIRSISTMRHYATFGINPWGPNYKFSWVLFPRNIYSVHKSRLAEFPITTNYSIAAYPCKIFSVSNHAKNKYATPRSGELFFETPMQNSRWKMYAAIPLLCHCSKGLILVYLSHNRILNLDFHCLSSHLV